MTEGHTERLEAALDGKYRIEKKLGEGGMASVRLADGSITSSRHRPWSRVMLFALCSALASCGEDDPIVGPEPPPRPFCVPAPSGVVSWWPGDASNRDVVGTNHLSLTNGSTYGPGVVDQGFALDDDNDYAAGEADGIGSLQQLTMEAWVRLDALAETEQRMVTLGPKAVLRRLGLRQLDFFMTIDGNIVTVGAPDVLQAGVFQHVAGTYNGRAMRLFVDGIFVGAYPITGRVLTTDHFVLGGQDLPLGGVVDEVTIYDRALTQPEIQSIVEAGSDGKCVP